MIREENIDKVGNIFHVRALVRVPKYLYETSEDVDLLVTHYRVLSSSSLSSLRDVNLHTPTAISSKGIARDVCAVACRLMRNAKPLSSNSHVQLTQRAVHAMLAAGVTCLELGTPAEGMSDTRVTSGKAGVLTETPEEIVGKKVETLTVDNKCSDNKLLVKKCGLLAVILMDWGN